jgi:hypothetical protein
MLALLRRTCGHERDQARALRGHNARDVRHALAEDDKIVADDLERTAFQLVYIKRGIARR